MMEPADCVDDVECYDIYPKILKIPSKVEPFIFRNKDMFDILLLLQQKDI